MSYDIDPSRRTYDFYNNPMKKRNEWIYREILTEEQIKREEYEYIHLKGILYILEFIDNV
jgi:hypothetical protein